MDQIRASPCELYIAVAGYICRAVRRSNTKCFQHLLQAPLKKISAGNNKTLIYMHLFNRQIGILWTKLAVMSTRICYQLILHYILHTVHLELIFVWLKMFLRHLFKQFVGFRFLGHVFYLWQWLTAIWCLIPHYFVHMCEPTALRCFPVGASVITNTCVKLPPQ